MTIPIVKRDQGDTSPAITTTLLVGASPYTLTGASVIGVVGGTAGSGAAATYMRWVLPATWNSASLGMGSVTIPLNPSALAPTSYPCWVPGRFEFEMRAVSALGEVTQWPQDQTIPFVVRKAL